MLQDDDATVRLAAAETWPATVDAGQEAPLRPLLADSDARVRARTAARLLGSRRRDEARETLLEMANSDEPEWRAEAVRAFGTADDGLAVATAALADPEPLVRRAAVSALTGHDAEVALGALVRALGDPDPGIRADAVEALVRTGPQRSLRCWGRPSPRAGSRGRASARPAPSPGTNGGARVSPAQGRACPAVRRLARSPR